jgi:hypothetical protein
VKSNEKPPPSSVFTVTFGMFRPTRLTSCAPERTVIAVPSAKDAEESTTSVPSSTTMFAIDTLPASTTVPSPTFANVPAVPTSGAVSVQLVFAAAVTLFVCPAERLSVMPFVAYCRTAGSRLHVTLPESVNMSAASTDASPNADSEVS